MAGRALARIVDQSLGMALNHRGPGSSLGATTIQSSKTVETVFDWKQAVSAGIFDGLVHSAEVVEDQIGIGNSNGPSDGRPALGPSRASFPRDDIQD